MSDEDDYMSDAFLKQIPDTRPGLLSKTAARKHEQKKKGREASEKNKQKPLATLEKEKREEGLGAVINSENKGFSLLQKMGYKPGMALGKSGVGRKEPVPVDVKLGRGGLGHDTEQKRKKEETRKMYEHRRFKRHKMEAVNRKSFVDRMNDKMKNKNVEKDFYKSQKVCEQLDSQLGITYPKETFFWPEALLPKEDEDSIDEPLDSLQPGYSRYVQDIVDEDDEQEEEEGHLGDLSAFSFTTEEKLDVLTIYLRTKHHYCIWCGTKYNDKEDLKQNCPGNTAQLHEDL